MAHLVSDRSTAERGFTMVEVAIVLVMLGIIAVIAVPRMDFARYRVDAATRSVVTTLGFAQRTSINLQYDVKVGFDSATRRFRIHEDANNNGIMDAGERVSWSSLNEGIIFARGSAPAHAIGGAAVNLTRTQSGLPVLTFHRDGSASESGGFYITTQKAVDEGNAHMTRAIEFSRATGRVYWHSYPVSTSTWTRGTN